MTKPTDKDDQTDTEETATEAEEVEDAVIVEDEPEEETEAEAPAEEAESEPEVEPEPERPEPQRAAPARSGGILPLFLGGILAGGLGYGVETYLDGQQAGGVEDLTARLTAQEAQISELRAALDAVPTQPDMGPLEARLDGIAEQISSAVEAASAEVRAEVAGLETRLADLEKRPLADGTLSDTALAAYERELEALRAELAAQQESVSAMASQAEADLAAARAEAEALEADAVEAARRAAARAAVNRIAAAVETGSPFADVLPDLEAVGVDIPEALAGAAAEGVMPLAALRDGFGDAARAGMAVARAEGLADADGTLGSFLRSQFDVRSTEPREGDDPDAILSRVQAAVEDGRLQDALAEIGALPEVVRAEMSDWTRAAETRTGALNAISALSAQLNEN